MQFITDVSGAGNNFAHGHHVYGPLYADRILEAVREAAELCDSLQSFFLMHSLGGGTGSGLGTYVLGLLEDAFPDVHRFVSAVFPSPDDDVVTSPYNSMLALHQVRSSVANACLRYSLQTWGSLWLAVRLLVLLVPRTVDAAC